jgi:hypothetical protein
MISMHIVDSDAFLDMPHSTQNLYMHMLMRADDDGFVSSPKKIGRMVGSNEDDLKILFGKKFVIPFESGVCVIKHWKIHNYIAKDRYQQTKYIEEMAQLKVKSNGGYTLYTECIQNDDTGKVRLGKVSITDKSVSSSLSDKENDMAWKKIEETIVDYDSGEVIDEDGDLKKKDRELKTKIKKNLSLVESPRGLKYNPKSLNADVKSYTQLLLDGWTHTGIIKEYIEIIQDPYWKEQREKGKYPSMNTVEFRTRNKQPK